MRSLVVVFLGRNLRRGAADLTEQVVDPMMMAPWPKPPARSSRRVRPRPTFLGMSGAWDLATVFRKRRESI